MLEGQTHDSLLISRAADRGGGGGLSHYLITPTLIEVEAKSTRHFLEPR